MSYNSLTEAIRRDAGVLPRAIEAGYKHLRGEAWEIKDKVVAKYYTGRSGDEGLKRRTGAAANAWRIKEGDGYISILNETPYADFSEEMTIKPKKAKALSIPIGQALTKAGVPRYNSPRDVTGLKFIPSKKCGTSVGVLARVTAGQVDPMFALVRSVTIPAYTKTMDGFVHAEAGKSAERLADAVLRAINDDL